MKTYNFYIDSKHTVWIRAYHSIDANSEEEAKEMAKKIFRYSDRDSETHDEILSDTFESISFEENGNQPTEELIWPARFKGVRKEQYTLSDNTPLDFKRNEKIKDILNEE